MELIQVLTTTGGLVRRGNYDTDRERKGHVKTWTEDGQGERPPTPWSWTSGLGSCGAINVCCLSHRVCGPCYGNLKHLTPWVSVHLVSVSFLIFPAAL